jgi:hypothetical protein
MPLPGGSGFLAPFVKALENKKSFQSALRLNSYENLNEKRNYYRYFRNNGIVGLDDSELQHYFGMMTPDFFRKCLFRLVKGVQSGDNIFYPQSGD